jgi:glycosyltransferase involved in cell wall biosynthesis
VNLAIARFARPSAVRVAQDHMNLARYTPGLRAAMAEWYPRLDAVTALTNETAEGYRELLGSGTRVEAIPNGVPSTGGRRAALDAKVVVSAGRLTLQKGFDRLLPVWAKVAERHPDWELRVYGEGRRLRDLRKQASELGLGGKARLMGYTSKLPDELAASSIYVMSSRFEGFPMVLLEAMGVGLPVVSYDCPTGPAEIVTQGVDGYVVPDGDGDALAGVLSELMDDPEKRRAFGAAAVEKAARYDPSIIASRFEALLEELAASRPGRADAARHAITAARDHRPKRPPEPSPKRPRGGAKRAVNSALARVTGYQLVKVENVRSGKAPKGGGGNSGAPARGGSRAREQSGR